MLAMRDELFVLSHMDDHFFWQNRQVPHAIWKETTTLSPTFKEVTSGPTRSMRPLGRGGVSYHSAEALGRRKTERER